MKRIIRMIAFSAAAIYITSLWNKGFNVPSDLLTYTKASLIIAVLYYLITPISKLLLLPFNIFSLGFISVLAYFALFYFVFQLFPIIQIKDWLFQGFKIYGMIIPSFTVNHWQNVALSSISVSTIINFLELAL